MHRTSAPFLFGLLCLFVLCAPQLSAQRACCARLDHEEAVSELATAKASYESAQASAGAGAGEEEDSDGSVGGY